MTSTPGFEPGPHWWEASDLTTTPSFSAALKIIIVGTGDGLKPLRCEYSPLHTNKTSFLKFFFLNQVKEKIISERKLLVAFMKETNVHRV